MIERWQQHYDEHLNGVETEHHGSRRNSFIGTTDEEDVPIPTRSEVNYLIPT